MVDHTQKGDPSYLQPLGKAHLHCFGEETYLGLDQGDVDGVVVGDYVGDVEEVEDVEGDHEVLNEIEDERVGEDGAYWREEEVKDKDKGKCEGDQGEQDVSEDEDEDTSENEEDLDDLDD